MSYQINEKTVRKKRDGVDQFPLFSEFSFLFTFSLKLCKMYVASGYVERIKFLDI